MSKHKLHLRPDGADTWLTRAACHTPGVDPDWWHPDTSAAEAAEHAIRICRACPVARECLTAALAEEGGRSRAYRFGIRGGATPEQRHRMYQNGLRRRDRESAA